ncbi:MAG: 6-phosphogluconolactonase, partial [bacterium]
HSVLRVEDRYVVKSSSEEHSEPRITMTYPCLRLGRSIHAMITGEAKSEVVKKILDEPQSKENYPVVELKNDIDDWWLDEPAAKYLDPV